MEDQTCKTCAYYYQHYTFNQRRIIQVCCGHCAYRNPRTRKPDARACEAYVPADREEVFASREYLSKALLEYVLKRELLPQIFDAVEQKRNG